MNEDTSNRFLNLVLDEPRRLVLSQLRPLIYDWYLAGGTALALQIGHRISFDFDFFSQHFVTDDFRQNLINALGGTLHFTMDTQQQITFFTSEQVKITFAKTPYAPLYPLFHISGAACENMHDIAADKAFTVGRRGIFRDYVDLFFLLSTNCNLEQIITDAQKKYGAMFDEKLFLQQLDYMDDISDFSLDFIGPTRSNITIQNFLHTTIQTYLSKKGAIL